MLRNQLKFFIRIFLKDKFFSVLNILGLALGISVSIILLLILQNDLTYDKHYANYQRIYRLGSHLSATGLDSWRARSARELAQILKAELPEVQEITRANNWDHTLIKYQSKDGEKAFYEEDVVRTDSDYFRVFSHKFLMGDPKTCLTELNTLVITESTAKKYFGEDDPMNKSLIIDNESWRVTGVIEDLPENTHLKFDFLLSRLVQREWVVDNGAVKSEAFWNPDVYTYMLLPEGYNKADFDAKFVAIYNKYFRSFGEQVGGKYTPVLEPLADIHFHSKLDSDEPHGNLSYLYAFSGIGIFIVLLACINYMNLSTAKSVTRAAEIAMKKTLGSTKRALMLSFMAESVTLSVISLFVAIGLVLLVLKATPFNQLIGKHLTLDLIHNPILVVGAIAIAIGIGVVSGIYPAMYLPRIPTLTALKGSFKNKKSSHTLRKVLITTQFAISIFVVVCTLFMQKQIDFVRNSELGFVKENILLVPILDSAVENHSNVIKDAMLQNPHITSATTAYNVMGFDMGHSVMWAEGEGGEMKQQAFTVMFIGDNYLKTLGITMASGRDYQTGPTADIEDVFIANESAAKLMGWGSEGVGKKIKWFHGKKDGQVIGTVKDFNFASLHERVQPLIMVKANGGGGYLYLRVKGDNLPETIKYVEKTWKGISSQPFEYFFLDQRFNEQYKDDEVQHKLLSGLSFICVFISMLGLLGLSAFSASQRTKEIGVRKVLGASIPNIIFLLSKNVLVLVVLATVLVIPISIMVMDGWMQNFAYRVSLSYALFILVMLASMAFVFLTVAFHSLKTARTNPVDSLRTE